MAVITAAVAAVTAAVATTTLATVATAVVAVSTAVGVTGLVVGGIGMAIGNEDLMFAGKVMGYVGLAGGLAGGLIGGVGAMMGNTGATFMQGFGDAFAGASQHLSNAWDKGVGSWFAGGDKVTGAVSGAADDVTTGAVQGVPSTPASPVDPAATGVADSLKTTPPASLSTTNLPQSPANAPMAAAPNVAPPVAPTVTTPNAIPAGMNNAASWLPAGAGATPPATGGGLVSSMSEGFSNMPDWMKYSMMTTGAQGITGLAGGYFQGKSAEEQLKQQQLVAQREENQRQLLNSQANQVPSLRF